MKALQIDDAAIQGVLREQYGLSGECMALVSERDHNLRLSATDGRRYIVKIAGAEETELIAGMQAEALAHIQVQGFAAEAPEVIRTVTGDLLTSIEHEGRRHIFRVVSYVSGSPMSGAEVTPQLAASFGRVLAELGLALRAFDHPGKHQPLLWDMQRALMLQDKLACIPDAGRRSRLAAVFEAFGAEALPQFATLRRQVIHNDANPDNVMVDALGQSVTGIIDFGDMLEAPLLVDLAVAASYLRTPADPLSLIVPFVAAYHARVPLTEQELDLLHLLIRTRVATTVTMCHWRAASYAENDDYLQFSLATEGDAGDFLEALDAIGPAEFRDSLLKSL